MDITTLSFCFPADDPRCATLPTETVLDSFQKLCDETAQRTSCHVVLGPVDGKKVYTVSLSGQLQSVITARGVLLNSNPWLITEIVKASRYEILKSNHEINPLAQARINEIQALSKAQITLRNSGYHGPKPPPGFSSKIIDLAFTGLHNQVDTARIRVLILLDEIANLYVERVELDVKLHNITAGRKHSNAMRIMEETMTNIYFPSSLVLNSRRPATGETPNNYIYLTGEYANVQKAKENLLGLALRRRKQMVTREVAVLPRKLDWMLTARPDDLLGIMADNATYIEFPSTLAQTGVINVFAENRVDAERTIRSIMQLSCYHFAAWLWVNPPQPGGVVPVGQTCTLPPQQQLLATIAQISHTTGAEILLRNYVFEIYGLDNQVRLAYQHISVLDFVRNCHRESKFQVELANEHRDFISGKKNGKINKIMKSTNVRIKYETFNEYNFIIDVWSVTSAFALEGLSLLQEELPAEISFFVPESYHKRIIGVGGKNIQRIMKKFGVYVKFSNAEEYAALGGYFESNDNVVARTPAKNAVNLEYLKQSVMELVGPKDKDFVTELIAIPRQHHRAVVGDHGSAVHNIETQTGTVIRFPNKETGSDFVRVTGPIQQTRHACQLLTDIIPEDCEVRVSTSSTLLIAVGSVDFREKVVARLQREYNVTLLYTLPSSVNRTDGEDYLFLLRYNKGNADLLSPAKEALITFLAAHQIRPKTSQVLAYQPNQTPATSEAFSEGTFQHFNSKLIASVPPDAQSIAHSFSSYSLFDKGAGNAFANSRAIGSAPNLRALFDNMTVNGPTVSSSDGMKRSNSTLDLVQVGEKPDRWNKGKDGKQGSPTGEDKTEEESRPVASRDSEPPEDETAFPDQNFIDKLVQMSNDKDFNKLKVLFEELNVSKYTQLFIDQEVDFDMFLTLSNDELDQLGVKTFGSRRKMVIAIQEIKTKRANQKEEKKKLSTGNFVSSAERRDEAIVNPSKRAAVISGNDNTKGNGGGSLLTTSGGAYAVSDQKQPSSVISPPRITPNHISVASPRSSPIFRTSPLKSVW